MFLSRSRDDVPILFCKRPAPGYRSRDTGALSNVGSYGCSWASTVSGTGGMSLGFYVTWLYPSNAYYRAYGFQLRCLSE
ncbi:hypothetical protein [uncultured Rikenella sp.]|uniref:hypothetical protein n=1 Tax=uncultured Rikenella sp. TaxID=368003 RepID=UPI00262037BD|nr:hypothetical protein [uncultured Rikenella sp.]